jgi:hypothetical protein
VAASRPGGRRECAPQAILWIAWLQNLKPAAGEDFLSVFLSFSAQPCGGRAGR